MKGVVDGIGMIIGVSNWVACVLPGDFSESQMKSMLSFVLRQQLSVFLFFLSIACVSGNEPPNVLLISIDDLNDWVGCLGGNLSVQGVI